MNKFSITFSISKNMTNKRIFLKNIRASIFILSSNTTNGLVVQYLLIDYYKFLFYFIFKSSVHELLFQSKTDPFPVCCQAWNIWICRCGFTIAMTKKTEQKYFHPRWKRVFFPHFYWKITFFCVWQIDYWF